MRMRDILNVVLSDWEEGIAASAFVQGANAAELALHPLHQERVARAVEGLKNLPKRVATELALEALTVGARRS